MEPAQREKNKDDHLSDSHSLLVCAISFRQIPFRCLRQACRSIRPYKRAFLTLLNKTGFTPSPHPPPHSRTRLLLKLICFSLLRTCQPEWKWILHKRGQPTTCVLEGVCKYSEIFIWFGRLEQLTWWLSLIWDTVRGGGGHTFWSQAARNPDHVAKNKRRLPLLPVPCQHSFRTLTFRPRVEKKGSIGVVLVLFFWEEIFLISLLPWVGQARTV